MKFMSSTSSSASKAVIVPKPREQSVLPPEQDSFQAMTIDSTMTGDSRHEQKQQQPAPSSMASTVSSTLSISSSSDCSCCEDEDLFHQKLSHRHLDDDANNATATEEESRQADQESPLLRFSCQLHAAPAHVKDYADNPTVFGRILRGEAPAYIYHETDNTLCFKDIHPHAPLHGLVIPKECIPTIQQLTPAHLPLLEELREAALRVLNHHAAAAFQRGDYRLCFHVPPYNSVDHLHLHVLAPVSNMSWYARHVRYNCRTELCVSLETVMKRLREQEEVNKLHTQQPKKQKGAPQRLGKKKKNRVSQFLFSRRSRQTAVQCA